MTNSGMNQRPHSTPDGDAMDSTGLERKLDYTLDNVIVKNKLKANDEVFAVAA